MKRLSAVLSGRVQGVWLRIFIRKEANRLGLVGWVRNNDDGTVELVAEGSEEALERFATSLQAGTPLAQIDQIQKQEETATGEFNHFAILK